MLALLLLASAAPQTPRPPAPAKATVRIERAVEMRARDWGKPTSAQQREVRRTDEQGRPILLRLVEHP